jgi:uncharacterized Zn finger protein
MKEKPQVPYSLYVVCPVCGEETLHKVHKGKVHAKGQEIKVEATVECNECGRVHAASVVETKPILVPAVVSWKDSSERISIEMAPEDEISVGDVIQHEFPLLVTSVETKVRRERKARAADVVTLWTKRYDKVVVKFSVSKGMRASSYSVEAAPEEEFCAQDIVELERGPVIITSIRTTDRNIEHGSAPASDIVRIYARPVRESRSREPPVGRQFSRGREVNRGYGPRSQGRSSRRPSSRPRNQSRR